MKTSSGNLTRRSVILQQATGDKRWWVDEAFPCREENEELRQLLNSNDRPVRFHGQGCIGHVVGCANHPGLQPPSGRGGICSVLAGLRERRIHEGCGCPRRPRGAAEARWSRTCSHPWRCSVGCHACASVPTPRTARGELLGRREHRARAPAQPV